MGGPALRVAILGINYAPEPTGIAPYTTGIAQGLAKRGHHVQVLTGYPHYPYWKRGLGEETLFRSEEAIEGVRVRRLMHPIPRRFSLVRRAVMELCFGLQLMTTRWGRPDVIVCVTPPLIAAALASVRARLSMSRPAIGLLVQDMYGRGISETGAASGLSAGVVRAIEAITIRLSDGISVIHEGFARDLADDFGVEKNRMREIRNWTHVDTADQAASAAFRATHGWTDDEIVILHAGNMGYKQGLENVVAAAQLAARTNSRVKFVLLGDGNQRAELEGTAAGVTTLEFLSPVPETELPAALGAADILLVNERPGVAHMSLPSKLTSYFAAGRPILAAADPAGFTCVELVASGAGICVPPGQPEQLLSAGIRLATDQDLSRELGVHGRAYCAAILAESAAIDAYEDWVVSLASSRARGTAR